MDSSSGQRLLFATFTAIGGITPSVAVITVTPASATLTAAGQTQQLTAAATDSSGNALQTTFTWRSLNPQVASVTPTGIVSAISEGNAGIVAESGGRADTAEIIVQLSGSVPPPPTGAAPEPTPGSLLLYVDNFNAYVGIDSNDPAPRLSSNFAVTPDHPSLVSGRGGLGRAVRFSYSSSVSNLLLEKNFSSSTNLFVRYWYRTSPGADPTMGGTTDGLKWFMAHRANGPRYTMGVNSIRWSAGPDGFTNSGLEFTSHDNGSQSMPNPFVQNVNKASKFGTTNDGNWHRYTIQIRTGNGGFERIWIDGQLVLDSSPGAPGVPATGYDHASEGVSAISFPGTLVSPLRTGWDFYVDVDDLVIWR